MLPSVLVFLVLGLVLGGTYWLLELSSGWLNRRGAERERRAWGELSRELGGEAISTRARPSDDVLWAARLQDTVVRVTRQQIAADWGPETRWLVELEDPAFDAPRAELPAMAEALRKQAVLPDAFSLEKGKLSYTEPAKSVQAAIGRIRALLALLEPAPPSGSASAAPAASPSR